MTRHYPRGIYRTEENVLQRAGVRLGSHKFTVSRRDYEAAEFKPAFKTLPTLAEFEASQNQSAEQKVGPEI
ncbi:hypothetical protein GCM10007874_58840 [Labrys miyagiensis]|uniref:Uncharacterized protein n=1 Tax=Labrys miyagiensis TaxID=346912 RepID=A0ABQ6CT03_9HYPH|nr:hypothetical protein GCM10007874_58840 [Labrys miyagiensis]